MGKKYIIEIGRLERLYKAFVSAHGKPEIMWLSPEVDLTPYTEPDLEQVRKEAYEKGLVDGNGVRKSEINTAYQRGLSDIWEAMDKIANMYADERRKIFGEVLIKKIISIYSASEAIEKIRQYEQEQEEYHIGDEVIRHYKNESMEGDDTPSIFLYEEYGHFRCLAFNGRSIMIVEYPKNQYRKTGRHFPEIAEVLQKMKETDNG